MPAANVLTFHILSETINPEGMRVVHTLFSTKSEAAFTEMKAAIATKATTQPKLRAPSLGNSRAVKLVAVADPTVYIECVKTGVLRGMKVGSIWASLTDAAEELCVSHAALKQMFYAARKANGGIDAAVVIRGLELAYAEERETIKE